MPADDAQVAAHDSRDGEPWIVAGTLRAGHAFFLEGDATAHIAVAHAGEHVDAGAQAIDAAQARRPGIGLVAEHLPQQALVVIGAQACLDFAGDALGAADIPTGCQSGMHHHRAEAAIDVQQRAMAQPGQQFFAIRCKQHRTQFRVDPGLVLLAADADGEQGQVMVAEGDHGALVERLDQAQHLQRLPATIDQVTAKPQRIAGWIVVELVDQARQFVVAALDVANGPDRHVSTARSCDRHTAQ